MSEMPVLLSPIVTIEQVMRIVIQKLQRSGYSVVTSTPHSTQESGCEKELLVASVLMGRTLGDSAAYLTLRSQGSEQPLEKHTESIYARLGITPYFILACVKPADEGGHTCIFDGRHAASIIRREYPEIAETKIEYTSSAYPEQSAVHALVAENTLRYRGKCRSNKILNLPPNYSEDTFYQMVESVLARSLILQHEWRRGDILLINNMITLHSRTSFKGLRVMVRVRVDDPLNNYVRY